MSNVVSDDPQYQPDSMVVVGGFSSVRIEPNFTVYRQDSLMERRVVAELPDKKEALQFCIDYTNLIDIGQDVLKIHNHKTLDEETFSPSLDYSDQLV